jgi:phage-related protein
MDFDDVVNTVSDGASSAWNAVSDGASQAWDAASSTASNAVNAVEDGASNAWNAVSDTASSAVNSVEDGASSAWDSVKGGASSLMSTVSDDASAAWNAVKGGASAAWDAAGDGLTTVKDTVIHGDPNWTKDTNAEQQALENRVAEDKAKQANPEIQKFYKAKQDQNAHENSAHDAGFDSAQHMQDYQKATADFQAAWDKINACKDSDQAEKMRQQMGMPKSMDDYLRQQHIAPRGKPAY